MKLANAFGLWTDLSLALQTALIPTIKDVWKKPSTISQLSRTFMAHVWIVFASQVDANARTVKQELFLPNATGVVLDIGAGLGHGIQYLDRTKVTKYVAVEPNTRMHPELRRIAATAEYRESDGTLVILGCGAEEITIILESLGSTMHSVDTITSVMSMCSIPSAEDALRGLVRHVLKPGGQLLFYEHVLSPRQDVAWWQRFWAPMWQIFYDGCRLDCPTDIWINEIKDVDDNGEEVDIWSERKLWGVPGETEETVFHHVLGKFVKREGRMLK
ncbi:hypothetical protein J3R30DRAFT_3695806 [Lentinula aciculospora]|uniref:S-adenosyl-L-methionine-dependent methyltransferase n=1 Tax=Lentinula aciculospora TaxID=153920 RepID=A0A9W9ASF2_9AGAR|nr:hypothetical protein J3R30DRAFT_3695806 [Lentinula aciculospora]